MNGLIFGGANQEKHAPAEMCEEHDHEDQLDQVKQRRLLVLQVYELLKVRRHLEHLIRSK